MKQNISRDRRDEILERARADADKEGLRQKVKISHEEISEKFVASKTLDFEAMGQFVRDIGPELVLRDEGVHGFVFGKFNLLACMFPNGPLADSFLSNLSAVTPIADAMQSKREAGPLA